MPSIPIMYFLKMLVLAPHSASSLVKAGFSMAFYMQSLLYFGHFYDMYSLKLS